MSSDHHGTQDGDDDQNKGSTSRSEGTEPLARPPLQGNNVCAGQEDGNSFLDRFVEFVSKTYNIDKAVKLLG